MQPVDRAGPLALPCLGPLVEEVAHDLPADRGIAGKKPIDY